MCKGACFMYICLCISVFKNASVAACSAPCTVAHVSGSLAHSLFLHFPYHCQLVIKTMWSRLRDG